MKPRELRADARERAKLLVRHAMSRVNLDIRRDPYTKRLVRTLGARNVTTVIDVGANVGQFAVQLRHAGFAGRIISAEPLSSAYPKLARRASRDPRWDCVNVAIGDADGLHTMNVSANSYSSSLLGVTTTHVEAAPGSEYVSTEQIRMLGLADLVADRSIDPATTLLKVDTQGFERRVLDSAGALLGEFAAIQLELSSVELYEGQPLQDELTELLNDHGYVLWSMEPGMSSADGRMLQYDGLFVRP